MDPSGHAGAALAHRIVKANSVISGCRPILLISAANTLRWQAGNWTLTESELSRLGSWGARKFYAMSCKKRTRTTPWAITGNICIVWARTGGTFFAGPS